MYTQEEINQKARNMTKAEFIGVHTNWDKEYRVYDIALPQDWLNSFSERHGIPYATVRSSTVWAYAKDSRMEGPVSFHIDVQKGIEKDKVF